MESRPYSPTRVSNSLPRSASIDIYLFDQLLRGRLDRRTRMLDAGCGTGGDLHTFFAAASTATAIDRDPAAIAQVRNVAAQLAPDLPVEIISASAGQGITCRGKSASMDAVICSAVLHFASRPGPVRSA